MQSAAPIRADRRPGQSAGCQPLAGAPCSCLVPGLREDRSLRAGHLPPPSARGCLGAQQWESGPSRLDRILGPSEVRREGATARVEGLQDDYKNKHFIKQDSQGMRTNRGITGLYCRGWVHQRGWGAAGNYPGLAGLGWAFSVWTGWTPGIFWKPVQKPNEGGTEGAAEGRLLPPTLH